MRIARWLSVGLLLLALSGARAEAVTVRDIVELTRAGLSDEVLLALIETDATIFALDAQQIVDLRAAGVSEQVIVAMLQSGRRQAPEPPARPEPAPAPVETASAGAAAIPQHPQPYPTAVVVVPVPVAVPVVVPIAPLDVNQQILRGSVSPLGRSGFGRFINTGFIEHSPPPPVQPPRQ